VATQLDNTGAQEVGLSGPGAEQATQSDNIECEKAALCESPGAKKATLSDKMLWISISLRRTHSPAIRMHQLLSMRGSRGKESHTVGQNCENVVFRGKL
jgi:hypothetical protein